MSNTLTVILVASGLAGIALYGLYVLDKANKTPDSK